MDSSRILILGANGQLGMALQQQYPKAHTADVKELDITDQQSVNGFDWPKIDIILNAAAYTNVDGAETDEGRVAAWSVNAVAAANLAATASKHKLILVHISTDYVFDGTKSVHDEAEPFSPLSVYGASKAAGDIAVCLAPKHYILRTSWVIGDGNNFVRIMMGLAEKNISPTVVHDQIGRLTFTSELVRAIDHLLSVEAPYGVYNVTNDGPTSSWAEVTRHVFNTLGRVDLHVSKTTTAEYYVGKAGVAPRPLQSTLGMHKLHGTAFVSNDWREDLKHYIKKERE